MAHKSNIQLVTNNAEVVREFMVASDKSYKKGFVKGVIASLLLYLFVDYNLKNARKKKEKEAEVKPVGFEVVE